MIQDVSCKSTEARLRDCSYSNYSSQLHSCTLSGVASVRCRAFKTVYNTADSVLVTWEHHRHNSTSRQPSSFKVKCSNVQHNISTTLSSVGMSRISIGGLQPFTSYNCCVSAKYYGYWRYSYGSYYAEERCTSIEAMAASTEMSMPLQLSSDSNIRTNIIGGVLGFIIVILLLLLAVCGGLLIYLLRSRNSGVAPKR